MALYNFLLDPANVDVDYFVSASTEGGPLTLDNTATPDGLAHQLSFDGSDDIAAVVFTVVGTDADDNVITETVTGVTTSPVETVKYYKTVTSITPSDEYAPDTVDVGFVDEFVSPTLPLDFMRNVPSNWFVDQTGTVTWSVDFAIEDPGFKNDQNTVKWVAVSSSLESETADSSAFVQVAAGYTAARVRIHSYTNTAELRVYVSQPEVV